MSWLLKRQPCLLVCTMYRMNWFDTGTQHIKFTSLHSSSFIFVPENLPSGPKEHKI